MEPEQPVGETQRTRSSRNEGGRGLGRSWGKASARSRRSDSTRPRRRVSSSAIGMSWIRASCPVHRTRRRKVATVGCLVPLSYAAMAGCEVPARSASWAWVSPADMRAERIRSAAVRSGSPIPSLYRIRYRPIMDERQPDPNVVSRTSRVSGGGVDGEGAGQVAGGHRTGRPPPAPSTPRDGRGGSTGRHRSRPGARRPDHQALTRKRERPRSGDQAPMGTGGLGLSSDQT